MTRRLAVALSLLIAAAPAAAQKKKVAVLRFDDSHVQQSIAQMGGGSQDVGTGVADLVIQELVEGGKYSVVERSALEKTGAEQNLSQGQLTDPDAAAKIGRLLGVDIIIIGTISQFGAQTNSTTLNGGTNLSLKGFGISGVQSSSAKALVVITARLVDVNSEEVLAAATGKGESSKSGGVSLAGTQDSKAGGGTLDMTSSDFANSALGDATQKAVDAIAKQLNSKAASLPSHAAKGSIVVADVSGSTLILNAGTGAGLKVGDHLTISRFVRQVKDPASGAVIKTITDKIGSAVVTEVDESSATVTLTGIKPAMVGDLATSP